MPSSNFPKGFPDGLTVRNLPILQAQPGRIFWVSNNTTLEPGTTTGANGNPGTYERPLATIDYAIGKCRANVGDMIIVKPGHAETVIAASGITADVAGVAIVGLGQGASRPTLTFGTATTASMVFSAANVTLQNIVGIAGLDGLLQPFDLQAADLWLDIEWQDPTSLIEAETTVRTTAAADRLYLKYKHRGQTGGNANVRSIALVGVNGGRIDLDYYGLASTAVVNFITTASTDIVVTGYSYNSGAAGAKTIIDTVTGSTWFADLFIGESGTPQQGGSGFALQSVSVAAALAAQLIPTADGTANTRHRDVIGNKLDVSVYVPGTTKSIMAMTKGTADLQEKVAKKAAAVMVNGDTLFTVTGGPIKIEALWSECVTANDGTASTLQYSATPTAGAAQTISAASASLAAAAIGASVALAGTALSTAALLNANGPNLIANPGTVVIPAGTIKAVIGVGSTTGTWAHYIRYKPLAVGVTVA